MHNGLAAQALVGKEEMCIQTRESQIDSCTKLLEPTNAHELYIVHCYSSNKYCLWKYKKANQKSCVKPNLWSIYVHVNRHLFL